MSKRSAEEDIGGAQKVPRAFEDQVNFDKGDEQQPDDELDSIGIPTGWRQCPPLGQPLDRFIPIKVPLGARFDHVIKPLDRFTPAKAKEMAENLIRGQKVSVNLAPGGEPQDIPKYVGLVVDLTNSSRYYDSGLWQQLNLEYSKIPCKGRGEVPHPDMVNEFVGDVMNFVQRHPAGMILVHCTHGFNRTGYLIVSYLLRMHSLTVCKALDAFSRARPPGIYKPYYIRQLFNYYHEGIPMNFPFPVIPEWKGGDSPEREHEDEEHTVRAHLHHEDVLGEQVSSAEAFAVTSFVLRAVHGDCTWDGWSAPVFPGSQPVSLGRDNMRLLKDNRYWVTWKADGTRYMLAIMRYGTYLVDRKFQIRRVQMRFPQVASAREAMRKPVGPPHNETLLDGEMIVDHDDDGKQLRRFLIYDLVAINRISLADRPWKDRYCMIEDLVVRPRKTENKKIQKLEWKFPYQYHKEEFNVRRKEFWALPSADKLLNNFIPMLSHEADGLIFQPYYAVYKSGTFHELLKYKFPHMNSVDFRLKYVPGQPPQLLLLHPKRNFDYSLEPLEDAQVKFPEGEDPGMYNGMIVECAYDLEQQSWVFMRTRRDKNVPNARRVFDSVFRSIKDNITEADILKCVHDSLTSKVYKKDVEAAAEKAKLKQQAGSGQEQPSGQEN